MLEEGRGNGCVVALVPAAHRALPRVFLCKHRATAVVNSTAFAAVHVLLALLASM